MNKLSNQKKTERAEKLLMFLQWFHAETVEKGKSIQGSLRKNLETFEISYPTYIQKIITDNKIVINVGGKTKPAWKYKATIIPNMDMAKRIFDEAIANSYKHRQEYVERKNNKVGQRKTGIEQAKAAGVLKKDEEPKEILKNVPEQRIAPLSDDLFDVIQKIQLIANMEGSITTDEVGRLVGKAMSKNPALKKAYLIHIKK